MDTTTSAPVGVTPGSIVVGIDGSTFSGHALSWAAEQAVLERRPLALVHAIKPMTPGEQGWLESAGVHSADVVSSSAADGQALLDRAAERVTSRTPDLRLETLVSLEDARQTFEDLSTAAGLIVVGSRGRGPVKSLLLGSVSASVARHASCPVVVVRPHHPGAVRHGVLVGTDATERSLKTVEFGYRQASLRGMALTVLHCFWDVERAVLGYPAAVADHESGFEEQRLAVGETLAGLSEKFPDVHVQIHLARGAADECLLAAGAQMDLIVVGRHRSSIVAGVGGLGIGSLATAVIEHAPVVVAVVPDDA